MGKHAEQNGSAFIRSLSADQRLIHEALCESAYISGAKAAWNASCELDPQVASNQFYALLRSREGHLKGYVAAKMRIEEGVRSLANGSRET